MADRHIDIERMIMQARYAMQLEREAASVRGGELSDMEREGYQKQIDDLLNAVSTLLDANNAMGEKLENAQLLGERPAARGRKGPDERYMDKDMILRNEAENDGRSVYLHYDEESGCYKAFGLSAYYADMAASPVLSFSEDLQMPANVGKSVI